MSSFSTLDRFSFLTPSLFSDARHLYPYTPRHARFTRVDKMAHEQDGQVVQSLEKLDTVRRSLFVFENEVRVCED